MKNRMLAVMFPFVAAFQVECQPSAEKSISQQIQKIRNETLQATQDLQNYSHAQKAEFMKQMRSQLAVLDQDLTKLSANIESSRDAVKAEAKPKLQALREQSGQLNKQLDEVRNATESTWDSLKVGSKNAYDALADGFQQARQWVSNKIAS